MSLLPFASGSSIIVDNPYMEAIIQRTGASVSVVILVVLNLFERFERFELLTGDLLRLRGESSS